MLISLQYLKLHHNVMEFDEEFQPGTIDLGSEATQVAPLKAAGRATLIPEHDGKHQVLQDIRVVGELSTKLEIPCARCLEAVPYVVNRSFQLLFRPQTVNVGPEEAEMQDKDAEVAFYEGDGVELEDILREQVLLAVPIKTVCREACKGLCPHCGKNLNTGECHCEPVAGDPRWDALKDLRGKLSK
ncbi:MAG: YceD family protein [Terriglobales bacterium]